MATVAETLAAAQRYHQSGDLQRAEQFYRQVLQADSGHAQAWYLLGAACQAQGKLSEAVAYLQRSLEYRPFHPEAYNHLGITFAQQGQLDNAAVSFGRSLQLKPGNAEAHHNLALVLLQQGKREEAVAALQQAVRLKPNFPEALHTLGVALKEHGKLDEAMADLRQVVQLRPQWAEAHHNLGHALWKLGKLAEAVASYQQAIRLRPDFAVAYNHLGLAFSGLGKPDEALASYQRAVRLKPDFAVAHNNLANAYKDHGLLDEAIASYRQAIALDPTYVAAHSNLIMALHYHPAYDPATIFAEHRHWAEVHAQPLAAAIQPHTIDRTPGRRLRIGYVSPDFREHVMGYFIEPILAAHDRSRFEVFCYANVSRPDATTQRMQVAAEHWRWIVHLPDADAADLIRRDQIDILIDLAGHTGDNRLLIFARKPAPIQVTHFGYADTTGLPTMDYRFTDAYADPPGMTEQYYTEELVRLPDIGWYYQPPAGLEVGPLPALQTGHVTFGSFNHLSKVTPQVLDRWARILQAVPGSRMLILTGAGAQVDQRIRDAFGRHGIDAARLTLAGRRPRYEYMRLYHEVDLCLDSFPFPGCNTTSEAIWMGVPVITLAGHTFASRQGVSLLSHLGLYELIAETPEAYEEIAVRWAGDLERLGALRGRLRDQMKGATLTNAPRFTRQLEDAYQAMWEKLSRS
jgi:predicted O-linked N-acetylglucosamine transferase (SPINDLY family)